MHLAACVDQLLTLRSCAALLLAYAALCAGTFCVLREREDALLATAVMLIGGRVTALATYAVGAVLYLALLKAALELLSGPLGANDVQLLVNYVRALVVNYVVVAISLVPLLENYPVNYLGLLHVFTALGGLTVFHRLLRQRFQTLNETSALRSLAVILVESGVCICALRFCWQQFAEDLSEDTLVYVTVKEFVRVVAEALVVCVLNAEVFVTRALPTITSLDAPATTLKLLVYAFCSLVLVCFSVKLFLERRASVFQLLILNNDLFLKLWRNATALHTIRKNTFNVEASLANATLAELVAVDSCIICSELLTTNSKRLQCGHVMHVKCLKRWFAKQLTCPVCRQAVEFKHAAARCERDEIKILSTYFMYY